MFDLADRFVILFTIMKFKKTKIFSHWRKCQQTRIKKVMTTYEVLALASEHKSNLFYRPLN